MLAFICLVAFGSLKAECSVCNKYKCSTSINQCITTSDGVTKLDDTFCTGGEYCISYFDSNYDMYGVCGSYVYENRYPGAKCTEDSQCYSRYCLDGACKGVESGEQCNESKECDPGLYCDKSGNVYVCSALKDADEVCEDDSECDYGYGCNYGICTKFYSIPYGNRIEVTCDNYYNSIYCESATCAYDDGIYICIKAFKYVKDSEVIRCVSSSDCAVTSGTYTAEYYCYCGYNIYGYAYCPVLYGSSYVNDYFNFVKNWRVSSTAKKSHKLEELYQNLLDYGTYNELSTYIEAFFNYWFEFYYNADYCVTEIMAAEFRDYYDSQHLSDTSSLLFLEISAGILVLVIS